MYDLKQTRQRGLKILKQMNDRRQDTVAVVCGGDGTIMWVLSQLAKYKIDSQFTPVAIIPLGTGNDFSRNLGWGGSPFFKWSTKELKQFVRNWMEADVEDFDLWDASALVYQYGKFEKVSQQASVQLPQKLVQKTFCNYFSFGIDGQIGFQFDKLRTPSKFANFAVYGFVGAINDLKNPKTINQMIDSIYQTPTPFDDIDFKQNGRLMVDSQNKKLILHSKYDSSQAVINQGQRNILCLNIDSYTGGTTQIWKKSKAILKNEFIQEALHSDGMLEIVSFDSGLSIAMQKSLGGFAKRIGQTQGPLRVNFLKNEYKQSHCTYLQIDGQFLRMVHPKCIIIQKSKLLGGRIKVLRRNVYKKVFNPFKDLQQLFV